MPARRLRFRVTLLVLAAVSPAALADDDEARARKLDDEVERLYGEGRYTDALPLARQSLEIREKAHGKDHPEVGRSLNNLAVVLQTLGAYADALPLFERALSIAEKAFGKDDPMLAPALANLAVIHQNLGSYAEARPLYERALAIDEKALGKDHPDVATDLNSLAVLLQIMGSYAEARPLYERALRIREEKLGKNHPEVSQTLNCLAYLLQTEGSYAEARPLYERSLAICERALGKDHPEVAVCLSTLATLLQAQGSYAEARSLVERALAIREKTFGKDHHDVARNLSSLAQILQAEGSYDEARPLYERSLRITESALGKDHPEVANGLNCLAFLLQAEGSYAEARPLFERSLEIYEKAFGKDHPAVAASLNNLAAALRAEGSYAEAQALFARALGIWENALGKDNLLVTRCLCNLATVLDAQGAHADALPFFERALATAERSLRSSFAGLSATERVRFAAEVRFFLDQWLACAPRVGKSGYPEVLRFKGIVARAWAGEQALMRSADPATRKAVEELRAAERRLSGLANAMPPAMQADAQARWRKQYAEAVAERERLSLALAKGLAPYRQALERLDLAVGDVQSALREGEALVDVMEWGGRYLAFVLRREGEALRVELGLGEEIEAASAAFVEATKGEDVADAQWREAGQRLRAVAWEPVAAKLPKGVSTVYVSPDAALAAVPLQALPGKEPGRCLIDEVEIVLLPMAQDLVPPPAPKAPGEGALVVGGVDFGKRRPGAPRVAVFDPLPASADEAAGIGTRFGEGAVLLRGTDATEARLRREARGRRVLHLATHGFVREDLTRGARRRQEEAAGSEGLDRHLASGPDPMLLSGLAMAGAAAGDGGDGDDGILTALEASTLDLEACDLVVLSACDTAKGTAEAGEGVLGLVTGFRIAGARRVIGSLWKVDDEATRLLMSRFYDGILRKESPLTPAASLREAARWVRTQRGAKGRAFDAPRYWAAFVAYGK